eukprot:2644693-Pyramimonas_sp.AAC.1
MCVKDAVEPASDPAAPVLDPNDPESVLRHNTYMNKKRNYQVASRAADPKPIHRSRLSRRLDVNQESHVNGPLDRFSGMTSYGANHFCGVGRFLPDTIIPGDLRFDSGFAEVWGDSTPRLDNTNT